MQKFHRRVEVYFDTYLDYQEAKTRNDQLECFVHMVTKLRKDDFEWMDDASFDDLLRHLRGEKVITSYTDLLRHLRWILYSHLTQEEYDKLLAEISAVQHGQIALLKRHLKISPHDAIQKCREINISYHSCR